MRIHLAVLLALSAVSGAALAGTTNSLFDPRMYQPIAYRLKLSSGSILFDTKDGTSSVPVAVWSDGATSTTNTGVVVTNQSSNVVMALFCFGDIDVSSGVSCTVTGNLGLVLASQYKLILGANLALDGRTGNAGPKSSPPAGGAGGPGGEAGTAGGSLASAPPGAAHGAGGAGGVAVNGSGYGGGTYGQRDRTGGGGGYSGAGGQGGYSGWLGGVGGVPYGDVALTNLYGGSGGGGIDGITGETVAGGGGGGGALELISSGPMTISGTISARGGRGGVGIIGGFNATGAGGGSGGAIILAAPTIQFSNATNDASGGRGGNDDNVGSWNKGGGGGSGGRIAIYGVISGSVVTNVAGGTGGVMGAGYGGVPAYSGAAGTYTNIPWYPYKQGGPRGTSLTLR